MTAVGILGTGSYFPDRVVTNGSVAPGAGVTEEWIRRTGVVTRRRAADWQSAADLATAAARRALEQAGADAARVRHVVVATTGPQHPAPATAGVVRELTGARAAAALDVDSGPAAFVPALITAERLLRAAGDGYALVVGVAVHARGADRRAAVLLGDGAGAVLLGAVDAGHGLLQAATIGRGDVHHRTAVPAGGNRRPPGRGADGGHPGRTAGRGARGPVRVGLAAAVGNVLARGGIPAGEVRHVVPYRAAVAAGAAAGAAWPDLGLPGARRHTSLDRYGDTGAAAIPATLDLAHRAGAPARGELVLLVDLGGGGAGTAVLRWALPRRTESVSARRIRTAAAGAR